MPDINEPTMPERARRGTKKHPMDFTGRDIEQKQQEHADDIAQAAEQMSMATGVTVVRPKRRAAVHDYTEEGRPKPKVEAPKAADAKPKKYQVRMLADIDQMTFGRQIADAGDFTDPNNPRMPIVGPLLVLDFKEGEEYLVDEPLYEHLVKLGYVYGAE